MLFRGRIIKGERPAIYGMPSFEMMERPKEKNDTVELSQKSEIIEREAYEKGFASGEKAGYEMGEQKAALLLDRLQKTINEITEFKDRIKKELEPQAFELAVAIARRIVLEELNTKPDVIVRIVKEAIKKLERIGPITIKLNPALNELFMKKKAELLDIHPDILFDIDPSAPRTGPIVIGPSEEVVTDMDELVTNIVKDIKGKK